MTLVETYKQRLAVSEAKYAEAHHGEKLSESKKLNVAMLLNNTNKFINEQFANSTGTQRSDMGMWKKFCLNLVTVAVPNLIASDLVIVHPMASMSGYVTYIKYVAGTNKGATKQGDVFNDPFRLGNVDVNYTGAATTEEFTIASDGESTPAPVLSVKAAWFPVYNGTHEASKARIVSIMNGTTPVTVAADASVTVGADGQTLTLSNGTGTAIAIGYKVKVAYVYDNTIIPQNDLPILNAEIASIPLIAKVRRIAVYYSNLAAFQAKTDYGFDLGDQLAEKACGQLSYEIDTEVTNLLIANAEADSDLVFNKTVPYGISKAQHYEGFNEIVEIAKQKIYDKTKRFAPTYILISSSVLPILSFIAAFKPSSEVEHNGPYFAGTLNGLKVFVTPNIEAGKFVLGVNGKDMMSSAAVYAPYMPIIPTQLLGYADGGMSQGFSTMYALELLNADLLIAGSVVEQPVVVNTHETA